MLQDGVSSSQLPDGNEWHEPNWGGHSTQLEAQRGADDVSSIAIANILFKGRSLLPIPMTSGWRYCISQSAVDVVPTETLLAASQKKLLQAHLQPQGDFYSKEPR